MSASAAGQRPIAGGIPEHKSVCPEAALARHCRTTVPERLVEVRGHRPVSDGGVMPLLSGGMDLHWVFRQETGAGVTRRKDYTRSLPATFDG